VNFEFESDITEKRNGSIRAEERNSLSANEEGRKKGRKDKKEKKRRKKEKGRNERDVRDNNNRNKKGEEGNKEEGRLPFAQEIFSQRNETHIRCQRQTHPPSSASCFCLCSCSCCCVCVCFCVRCCQSVSSSWIIKDSMIKNRQRDRTEKPFRKQDTRDQRKRVNRKRVGLSVHCGALTRGRIERDEGWRDCERQSWERKRRRNKNGQRGNENKPEEKKGKAERERDVDESTELLRQWAK
jgi:hypothetical protein